MRVASGRMHELLFRIDIGTWNSCFTRTLRNLRTDDVWDADHWLPPDFFLDLALDQCCQMAKFDPFLSLDCTRVEGVGAQSKERKGSNFAA